MPRQLSVIAFKEFLGEFDGTPLEAQDGQASVIENCYFFPGYLKRRAGTSPLGAAALAPDQDLDGLHWYKIGSSEYLVSAHNGALYDWLAGAAVTNSTGKLTSGTEANGAWVDGRFFWGDGAKQNTYHDGTDLVQALTDAPSSAPSVAVGAATGPTGTYTYKVTFLNADGKESAASVASGSVTVANQKVSLTSIPTCGAGQDCSGRKIYRIKNGGSIYYLVTTIADNVTTTYTDSTVDGSLGAALRLNFDGETAADLSRFPPSRFLIPHQNRLVGAFCTTAEGDRQTVYISKSREPWYCPLLPDVEDPSDGTRITLQGPGAGEITGLCSHGDKVAVFTADAMFLLVTSDQLLDYALHRFTNHGCVAHRTIKSVRDMLLWLAPDGVYVAREGQGVERVSDDELNTLIATSAADLAKAHAFVWNDKYFLCFSGGTCLVLDLRRMQWTRNTSWPWRCSTVSVFGGGNGERIWAARAGGARVWQLETGTSDNGAAISAVWQSKDLDCGQPAREKRLHYVAVKWGASSGTATMRLYKGTGTTAIQTATKDLSSVDDVGATVAALDQRCCEQARSEQFRVRVEHADAAVADYRLLQVELRVQVVT